MGIGGALAEARSEAGLTVAQVSERTRIRETIIRGIERDDYSACGGDYYARGHIRAIARVVGTDPVPLIEEYDAARMPPEPAEPAADFSHGDGRGWRVPGWHRMAGNAAGATGPGRTGLNGSGYSGNGLAGNPAVRNGYGGSGVASPGETDQERDTNPELYDPATLAAERAGVLDSAARLAGTARSRLARPPEPPGSGVPGGITAAEAFRPSMPLEPRRQLPRGTAALALIVLAVIGLLCYLLVSGSSPPASSSHHSSTHRPAGAGSARHHAAGSKSKPAAASQTPVALTPLSASAFGPAGTGQGDNPQEAPLAIDGSDSTAWQTDWYSSSNFSGLQSGTGLLLDMGRKVTVTSARILLDATPGGELELFAGGTPSLADLRVVAQASNPGGTLTLPVSTPVRARYLLVWFTSLPPDSSGTYQASVYNVSLSGTS